jgi:hypothetical protein
MNELRKLIREILEEAAAGFMSVGANTGLVITKKTNKLIFNLFDFSKKECVGSITMTKVSDRAYFVETVAAESGFGPLMYEIAMMAVYPAGICVGGPTNDKAFSVFNKFATSRNEIKKIILRPGDSEYSEIYQNNETKHYLSNIIFMRTKSIWFEKLLLRGQMLMNKTSMNDAEINNICQEYFLDKYRSNF